ncbi:hypothetical protein LEP1GSC123_1452 [Leptospira borgpetersenii str. 200701203]|uniref:Uncharacterized protein n=1 Tax=Leptospira borgpetersenii str. 200701203 TaxID=1193007 RepID=M3GZA8_LEPBO|nr:hypothetical protein LEP1GSC123_1452 [Leptospira borgpetersenii str. 200701203]
MGAPTFSLYYYEFLEPISFLRFWDKFSVFFGPLVTKKTFNFIISNITARKKGKRQLPFFAKI